MSLDTVYGVNAVCRVLSVDRAKVNATAGLITLCPYFVVLVFYILLKFKVIHIQLLLLLDFVVAPHPWEDIMSSAND